MHSIKALVITCIDFRFHRALNKWLDENDYLGECDILSVAGASKDLMVVPVNQADTDYILRNIEISAKLHNCKEILIFDHQDCGGYASDSTIRNDLPRNEDFELHYKYLTIAKKLLTPLYPNITIRTFYIDLGFDIQEIR